MAPVCVMKKDIGFLSNGTGGDGGYPQLGKAGAGEWCLKMVVSACQETDGASSLASNPRKYREKKYKRGEGSSPCFIRFELFTVHRPWISDYIFRRFRTVPSLHEVFPDIPTSRHPTNFFVHTKFGLSGRQLKQTPILSSMS